MSVAAKEVLSMRVWKTEQMIGESDSGSNDVAVAPLDFDSYIAGQWSALWRFAYLVTGHLADAEDVVQDVLAKVWPRWNQICAKGDPGPYLRRCIANAKVNVWRKTRHFVPYSDITENLAVVEGHALSVTDALVLARVLQTLPPKQRTAVALRYLEDYSYEDIASVCGITQATARSLVRNSLNRLRSEMRMES